MKSSVLYIGKGRWSLPFLETCLYSTSNTRKTRPLFRIFSLAKNANSIIWYENDKAKRLSFFSFLTVKNKFSNKDVAACSGRELMSLSPFCWTGVRNYVCNSPELLTKLKSHLSGDLGDHLYYVLNMKRSIELFSGMI